MVPKWLACTLVATSQASQGKPPVWAVWDVLGICCGDRHDPGHAFLARVSPSSIPNCQLQPAVVFFSSFFFLLSALFPPRIIVAIMDHAYTTKKLCSPPLDLHRSLLETSDTARRPSSRPPCSPFYLAHDAIPHPLLMQLGTQAHEPLMSLLLKIRGPRGRRRAGRYVFRSVPQTSK